MKLFVDTADLDQIKQIQQWCLLDGVTTNPALTAKQKGIKHSSLIRSICEAVPNGSISAEVLAVDAKGIEREGKELAAIHPQVVVKVPLIQEGLKAVQALAKKNISVNVTLCFSALQALMAARAGADIVSVFVGRLDDIGLRGMEVVEETKSIFADYQIKTKVLAASIRHIAHVKDAALAGADIATIPPGLFLKMVQHPLTDKGLAQFLSHYKK